MGFLGAKVRFTLARSTLTQYRTDRRKDEIKCREEIRKACAGEADKCAKISDKFAKNRPRTALMMQTNASRSH